MFVQIMYAYICAVLQEFDTFLAGARFACLVVFLTINNFGHVCILIKVSSLFSVYRIAVSTVGTYSMYVCMYVQWGKKVFSQPPIVQVLPLKKMRGL